MSDSNYHDTRFHDTFGVFRAMESMVARSLREIGSPEAQGCGMAIIDVESLQEYVGKMRHHFSHIDFSRSPDPEYFTAEEYERYVRDEMKSAEAAMASLAKRASLCVKAT